MEWANRSLLLRRDFYATHQLVANALMILGAKKQAMLEIRLACEASPKRCKGILTRLDELEVSPNMMASIGKSIVEDVRIAVVAHLLGLGEAAPALALLEGPSGESPGKNGSCGPC